jgi:hypothetical protein
MSRIAIPPTPHILGAASRSLFVSHAAVPLESQIASAQKRSEDQRVF